MATGDGSSAADTPEGSSPTSGPDAPPPYQRGVHDPAVEAMWLRHRPPPHPRARGFPRMSTLLLIAAFIAVLVLYMAVRPGG